MEVKLTANLSISDLSASKLKSTGTNPTLPCPEQKVDAGFSSEGLHG